MQESMTWIWQTARLIGGDSYLGSAMGLLTTVATGCLAGRRCVQLLDALGCHTACYILEPKRPQAVPKIIELTRGITAEQQALTGLRVKLERTLEVTQQLFSRFVEDETVTLEAVTAQQQRFQDQVLRLVHLSQRQAEYEKQRLELVERIDSTPEKLARQLRAEGISEDEIRSINALFRAHNQSWVYQLSRREQRQLNDLRAGCLRDLAWIGGLILSILGGRGLMQQIAYDLPADTNSSQIIWNNMTIEQLTGETTCLAPGPHL